MKWGGGKTHTVLIYVCVMCNSISERINKTLIVPLPIRKETRWLDASRERLRNKYFLCLVEISKCNMTRSPIQTFK